MRMRLIAAFAAALVTFDFAAAADIRAPGWTGFYAGIHGGYGWNDGATSIGINDPSGFTQFLAANGVFPVSYSFDRHGYVAGVQAGYNYQMDGWLVGLEADIAKTDISGSQTLSIQCPLCFAPTLSSVSQKLDWFGTVRGRVGIVADGWLFYGTGGLAYGHVESNYLQTNVPFGGLLTITGARSGTDTGWVAGAGVERMFGRWSGKVEYLYYDLGSHSFSAPNPLAPPALGVALLPKFQTNGSLLRVGLNYRFN